MVWTAYDYFKKIASIPHGSTFEAKLSDYLCEFAKAHSLDYKRDDIDNVIIYKEAAQGYEKAEPLILQAHIDMVLEKEADVSKDLSKEAIEIYEEDGFLKARGTTLGADDGTGVAYMLSILADKEAKHPFLECIFTVREEIGLIGALHLKSDDIKADRMISLDGGGEIKTIASSAGGCRLKAIKEMSSINKTMPSYELVIKGLKGGHSGGEIDKERGNAIMIAFRVLKRLLDNDDVYLKKIQGGAKDNAIPRACRIEFGYSQDPLAVISELIKNIKREYAQSDEDLDIVINKIADSDNFFDEKSSRDLIKAIFVVPNGVIRKSPDIKDLVLTSLNVGIIDTLAEKVEVTISLRSALNSELEYLKDRITALLEGYMFKVAGDSFYPPFERVKDSKMREIMKEVIFDVYQKELLVADTHGGTECGVFKKLNPALDIISFGPLSYDIHTPKERLDIASFKRSEAVLKEIIRRCK